jgi:hypothetical protein
MTPAVFGVRASLLRQLVQRHCPVSGIFSRRITYDALGRIAIDKRPQVEGMLHAADFMLDGKQHFAAVRIDDVLESILVLIAFLGDQALRS